MPARRRLTLTAAAALVAGLLVIPTPAVAAAGPTTLPASQYTLSANYNQFSAINTALVSTLGTAAVHTVMDNANHDRTGVFAMAGLPGQPTGEQQGLSLVDVGPTIMQLYGGAVPEGAVGRSFL